MYKIVIYDFCHTLVDLESADAFIHFIGEQEFNKSIYTKECIRILFKKLKIIPAIEKIMRNKQPQYSLNKKWILWEIKGYKKDIIDKYAKEYYEKVIKNKLIQKTVKEIKKQKEKGYTVFIVSASYEPFLKLFTKEFDIDYLVTNEFKYTSEGIFTGKIKNRDCIGKEKKKRFYEELEKNGIYEYEICASYGDSPSDKYILDIAKNKYVISEKESKDWIKSTDYKEIIYGN